MIKYFVRTKVFETPHLKITRIPKQPASHLQNFISRCDQTRCLLVKYISKLLNF